MPTVTSVLAEMRVRVSPYPVISFYMSFCSHRDDECMLWRCVGGVLCREEETRDDELACRLDPVQLSLILFMSDPAKAALPSP